jgi:hypothetical protein
MIGVNSFGGQFKKLIKKISKILKAFIFLKYTH